MNTKTTLPREETMRVLREADVPDAVIAAAFGLTRQRVAVLLGPKPRPCRREPPRVDPSGLPARLKRWRKDRRLSMAAAAAECGVTLAAWSKWEGNRSGCSLAALLTLHLDLRDACGK